MVYVLFWDMFLKLKVENWYLGLGTPLITSNHFFAAAEIWEVRSFFLEKVLWVGLIHSLGTICWRKFCWRPWFGLNTQLPHPQDMNEGKDQSQPQQTSPPPTLPPHWHAPPPKQNKCATATARQRTASPLWPNTCVHQIPILYGTVKHQEPCAKRKSTASGLPFYFRYSFQLVFNTAPFQLAWTCLRKYWWTYETDKTSTRCWSNLTLIW